MAGKPDGERLLSDVGQIMELCCAAAKSVGALPENLINWLKERISAAADDEGDAEEYQRELETDGDAVRIMTIHASKGLQFPIVFLPDCWYVFYSHDPRNQLSHVFSYHDENCELVFATSNESRAREELRLEKIRLLYVALTRAERRTFLFAPNAFTKVEINRREPLIALLENLRGKMADAVDLRGDDAELSAGAPEGAADDGVRSRVAPSGEADELTVLEPPAYDPAPIRGSYSALSPQHGGDGGDDARDCDDDEPLFDGGDDGEVDPIFAVPRGNRMGTCWHNILEKLPFDAADDAIGTLAGTELSEYGFSDAAVLEQTVAMVKKTLAYRLTSPDGEGFTLREIPWKDRLSEQGFDFSTAGACASTAELCNILKRHWAGADAKPEFLAAMTRWSRAIPKGFMTGFIDLVFRRGGYYYIVDWKSNSLNRDIGNFSAEGIRGEMAEQGYFFQYMLYAAVLHRHLKATLGENYSWERCFGGIRYYFLRGIAAGGAEPVFADRPSEALLDEFSEALGMGEER